MRAKGEIISDIKEHAHKAPDWDTTASLHERIQIEVLIDIRDILEGARFHLAKLIEDSKEKD